MYEPIKIYKSLQMLKSITVKISSCKFTYIRHFFLTTGFQILYINQTTLDLRKEKMNFPKSRVASTFNVTNISYLQLKLWFDAEVAEQFLTVIYLIGSIHLPNCYIKNVGTHRGGDSHISEAFAGYNDACDEVRNGRTSGQEGQAHHLE